MYLPKVDSENRKQYKHLNTRNKQYEGRVLLGAAAGIHSGVHS